MSVEHRGVGGIGILVTDEMAIKMVKAGFFTKEEWEDDKQDALEEVDFRCEEAGNCFTGEQRFYLLAVGKTLEEVTVGALALSVKLSYAGIEILPSQLSVISDSLTF